MAKKRVKQTFTQNTDGTENLDLTCNVCGGSITHSTKYGMYCEKKCGEKEDKEAFEKGMEMLKNIFGGDMNPFGGSK